MLPYYSMVANRLTSVVNAKNIASSLRCKLGVVLMDRYDIQSVLGHGSFGDVLLGRSRTDGKLYAIKRITLRNERLWKLAEQEAVLLSTLKHSNVILYKESFVDGAGCLHIITKFAAGGDLSCEIERRKATKSYLSEKEVGDLGIARVLETTSDMASTFIGTPSYMSPELIAHEPYNHKSDIWALGCCMYEMVTFRRAFEDNHLIGLELKIMYDKAQRMPLLYTRSLRELVTEMLSKRPKNRPGIRNILKTDYVKSHMRRVLDEISGRKKNKIPKISVTDGTYDNTDTEKLLARVEDVRRWNTTQYSSDLHISARHLRDKPSDASTAHAHQLFPEVRLFPQPYNPDKYSDDFHLDKQRDKLKIPSYDKSADESGYHSTNTAPSLLNDSQNTLESSVRFYPIATLASVGKSEDFSISSRK